MGLKDDIKKKVKEIMDDTFIVEDVSYVPDISDTKLTFGNKGLRFDATVLYIDMRGSTKILNKHNRRTVAKIHMAYYHTIVKIAKVMGGEVRSFGGDSLLVFFQGSSKITLSNAVKTAMHITYMLTHEEGIKKEVAKYTEIDFGIGIDYGKILCTKVGLGGDSTTKDIFWAGNAVNKSVKLSDKSNSPSHISISYLVYDNLTDEIKYTTKKNIWDQDEKVNMWNQSTFTYNDQTEYYYYTNYWWSIV